MKVALILLALFASNALRAEPKYCDELADAGLWFYTMATKGISYYDARAKIDADPPPEGASDLIYLGLKLGYASYEQDMTATQAYDNIHEACIAKYKVEARGEDAAPAKLVELRATSEPTGLAQTHSGIITDPKMARLVNTLDIKDKPTSDPTADSVVALREADYAKSRAAVQAQVAIGEAGWGESIANAFSHTMTANIAEMVGLGRREDPNFVMTEELGERMTAAGAMGNKHAWDHLNESTSQAQFDERLADFTEQEEYDKRLANTVGWKKSFITIIKLVFALGEPLLIAVLAFKFIRSQAINNRNKKPRLTLPPNEEARFLFEENASKPKTRSIVEILEPILSGPLLIAYFAYGVIMLVAGYIGIENSFGVFLAVFTIIVAVFFQFTLPITVGAYFGATEIWGWDWYWALFFVAPGLVFLIPGVVSAVASKVKN